MPPDSRSGPGGWVPLVTYCVHFSLLGLTSFVWGLLNAALTMDEPSMSNRSYVHCGSTIANSPHEYPDAVAFGLEGLVDRAEFVISYSCLNADRRSPNACVI